MRRRIRKDHERFKRIVKGKIREDLKDLVSRGYLRGKEGSKTVKVPLKGIDIPEFRYDPRSAGGIGSGEGEPGDVVKGGDRGPEIQPGAGPGTHFLEVEIDVEELAQILGGETRTAPHRAEGRGTYDQEGTFVPRDLPVRTRDPIEEETFL